MIVDSHPQTRTPFRIMLDSIHALMLRETKTRFGANKLGYFWAVVEPMSQAAIMALLFTLLGRESIGGISIAMFLFVGILPYKLFAKLLPQLSASVSSNKQLFGYRQVSPIDPVFTRLFIEVVTFTVVYLLIMTGMGWLGTDSIPHDFPKLIAAIILLLILSLGLGLILCVATSYWEDTPKILGMVMTPMFFISGVFYCATMIPIQVLPYLTWNPIFHILELSRDAYFNTYTTPVGEWGYASLISFGFLAIGLVMFNANKQRFITL